MVIIGIIIGLVILLLTIFASSDGDKNNLNPMRAKVEPKESAVLCKLEKEMKELSQHCDNFFAGYTERLVSIEQHIGIGLDKDDPRMHLRLNVFNRPVVFIVEYTYTDDYGPYDHSDVFAYREDAEDFVKKLKEVSSGVSNISISPRIVYLDKDKTLDNVDNLFNKS